ncbi:hypothetical protein A9W98_17910 [Mycobacterium gordonae]|uniref:DUF2303 family protein n=1 Tax=Mycobacterium gordonae TaxID=1778 RepID=A0A1A6BHQ1_MYCGO|nr:DUF2303 family protein [Mycobacterium gordonae]OBS01860.1 hypothetical protein A9W98_17910 [Mycobacterium gordonae]
MTDNTTTTNIDHVDSALLVGARAPHRAQIIDGLLPHQRHAIAVTEEHGLQVTDIAVDPTEFPIPLRVKGERTVSELESFLAELERRPMAQPTGTLWGSAKRGVLTAIYNDHNGNGTDAGWRDDKLTMKLTADDDWAAWHAMSGRLHPQNEFGDKIEELLHTITSPDQAELLEVIDSIRSSTSGEFESKVERAHGGLKLTYREDHTVTAGKGRELEVPQVIILNLRPWEGHPETYPVEAKFRTRVTNGSLGLAIKLQPTAQILREAWHTITQAVTGQTGKPVLAVQ